MTDTLPLAGLNIIITRPRDQAGNLMQHVEQLGGKPLLFPLLEITDNSNSATLREQVSRLRQADLAIFISPNAVRYGVAAIRTAGDMPSGLQIAAVGQGSAKALRELGVAKVLAPAERFDSEGLLALPELQHLAGTQVMIFRGDGGRELLGDTLMQRGASVEYVTCYLRSKPVLEAGMLLDARADAITVTSSEALGNLAGMFTAEQLGIIAAVPLFVPHERIAAAARQQGWQHVIVTASGDDGMMSGLIAWAHTKRK